MPDQMIDVVALFLSPQADRIAMVLMCVVSAVIIGPFIAFAVTPGAGVRCRLALVRMMQRIFLCGLSISLMYWAGFIVIDDKPVSGPTLLVVFFLLGTTLISAYRHKSAPPVPDENRWFSRSNIARPH